jgi:hypothetical protein
MSAFQQMLLAASKTIVDIIISSNQTKYSLDSTKIPGGITNGIDINVTINSGVIISSDTTATAAFRVASGFTNSKIKIINNGHIVGMGGNGGNGAVYTVDGEFNSTLVSAATSGLPGGTGISVLSPIEMTNNGRISGGGGGGGAGYASVAGAGGGGGGQTGLTNSLTGSGGRSYETPYGTYSAPAIPNNTPSAGTGGRGGYWGAAGVAGEGYDGTGSAGNGATLGGTGGAAVTGNSNITWVVNGTRDGSIS